MHTKELPSPEAPPGPPEPGNRSIRLRPRLLLAAVLLALVAAFYALGLHRYLSWTSTPGRRRRGSTCRWPCCCSSSSTWR